MLTPQCIEQQALKLAFQTKPQLKFNLSNIHYIELQGWHHIPKILFQKYLQSQLHQNHLLSESLVVQMFVCFFFNLQRLTHVSKQTTMAWLQCCQSIEDRKSREQQSHSGIVWPPATHSNPVKCFSVCSREEPSCHLKKTYSHFPVVCVFM